MVIRAGINTEYSIAYVLWKTVAVAATSATSQEWTMTMTYILCLLLLLLACSSRAESQRYTNRWAVEVRGGPEEADALAHKYGFENRGQVRRIYRHLPTGHSNTHACYWYFSLGWKSERHLSFRASWAQVICPGHCSSATLPVDRSHSAWIKCECDSSSYSTQTFAPYREQSLFSIGPTSAADN